MFFSHFVIFSSLILVLEIFLKLSKCFVMDFCTFSLKFFQYEKQVDVDHSLRDFKFSISVYLASSNRSSWVIWRYLPLFANLRLVAVLSLIRRNVSADLTAVDLRIDFRSGIEPNRKEYRIIFQEFYVYSPIEDLSKDRICLVIFLFSTGLSLMIFLEDVGFCALGSCNMEKISGENSTQIIKPYYISNRNLPYTPIYVLVYHH